MKIKNLYTLLMVIAVSLSIYAQPARQLVQVIVTPDKSDWTYSIGERASFKIQVLQNNYPLEGIEVSYNIQPELMKNHEEGKVKLNNKEAVVKAKPFKEAGFLRCLASVVVDGKTYSSYATAGFSPEQIEPTTTLPQDFEAFWDKAKADLAKIP